MSRPDLTWDRIRIAPDRPSRLQILDPIGRIVEVHVRRSDVSISRLDDGSLRCSVILDFLII